MKKQAGFSLVEVLLALAVGGLVLMAASSLLVTISQSWANRPATRDAFDAHVNGIAHFLTAVLEEATLPKEGSDGVDVVELSRPVGFSETDDPLIKFYLREAPPFFYWPHGLASRVHVYFQFEEGEGLYFLWYSDLQELEKSDSGELKLEDEDQLFRTQISPYLEEVYYCYYGEEEETADEEKSWQIEPELEENVESGKFRIPDFIKIVFRWDEEDLERTITLAVRKPAPSGIEEEPK
ncbi:MAG: prepilin-type N-terminal cleavage/methylation domain-containing protein [Verrucomicrobia bacterium]|nr:prepilin-type N-terminal cleavage/methylation domain-containing protein [Verrucomicrobiota bacterium]